MTAPALRVGLLRATYKLPSAGHVERSSLDSALSAVLEETLERAIERSRVGGSELVCIRRLHVPVSVRGGAAQTAVADAWSAAIVTALEDTAARPAAGVVRYASRREALLDVAAGVAAGDIERAWAWRRLGLWDGPESMDAAAAGAVLVHTLLAEPGAIVPVVAAVARGGGLPGLAGALDGRGWSALAAAALRSAGLDENTAVDVAAGLAAASGSAAASSGTDASRAQAAVPDGSGVDSRPSPAPRRRLATSAVLSAAPGLRTASSERFVTLASLAVLGCLDADPGLGHAPVARARAALLASASAMLALHSGADRLNPPAARREHAKPPPAGPPPTTMLLAGPADDGAAGLRAVPPRRAARRANAGGAGAGEEGDRDTASGEDRAAASHSEDGPAGAPGAGNHAAGRDENGHSASHGKNHRAACSGGGGASAGRGEGRSAGPGDGRRSAESAEDGRFAERAVGSAPRAGDGADRRAPDRPPSVHGENGADGLRDGADDSVATGPDTSGTVRWESAGAAVEDTNPRPWRGAGGDRGPGTATSFGGLAFLLHLVGELGLPGRLCGDAPLGERSVRWSLHQLAMQLTGAAPGDPAALAFAGLVPDAEPPSAAAPPATSAEVASLRRAAQQIGVALALRLRTTRTPDLVARTCARRAHVRADPGWIELHLALDEVDVDIRRFGLDHDPGYVPWLGAVVRFVYA
jgi:hypothetical protein